MQPKLMCRDRRINPSLIPPCRFVMTAVDLTMVPTAEWDRELIADLAAECAALGKAQMMRVARDPATDQA